MNNFAEMNYVGRCFECGEPITKEESYQTGSTYLHEKCEKVFDNDKFLS